MFALFRQTAMAHVRSTTCPRDDAPVQQGKCAVTESDVVDKGRDNIGSAERTGSVCATDAGSQSNAKGDSSGGSLTCSCYFSPSIVTVSRIREMIDQGYFAEGGALAPGE
jgi:hypothetical protein